MAKQSGLIHYEGTLDNVKHFRIKGRDGYFAAMKGGVSKDRILNDDSFARTRENMSEFGGVAIAGKGFRSSLQGMQKKLADISFCNRISKSLFRILRYDTDSPRGQRSVMISEHPQFLTDIEWQTANPLTSRLATEYTLTAGTDHKSATLTLPALDNPADNIAAPAGATHFTLVLLAHAVSDYGYDSEAGEYAAINQEAEYNGTITTSAYIPLNEKMTAPVTLTAAVTIDDLENVTSFASVGVIFYQKLGDVYYRLNDGDSMKTVISL